LPVPFTAEGGTYDKDNFAYDNYSFTVDGGGESFWTSNEIPTGVGGLPRYGIGAFYFYILAPVDSEIVSPVTELACEEAETEATPFWDYLTTFWEFLTVGDRDMFENFWHGMRIAGNSMKKFADRFYAAIAPENAWTCVLDDYYEVQIGVMYSKPLNLDPTLQAPNYLIRGIDKKLIEPIYLNEQPIYRDMVEISATDYHKIRSVGMPCYLVVKVKNDDIDDKYFNIYNLLSSEEPQDRPAYAEIDETIHSGGLDDTIGRIAIEGVDTTDISEYTVEIIDNAAVDTTVTWAATSLVIAVKTSGEVAGYDYIQTIFDANAAGVTPWATLTNKSGKGEINSPLIVESEIDDLYNYKHVETSNNRYYPTQGKAWKWYEGYSSSDGDVGDTDFGEYIDSPSKFKYMIVVEGDLSYIRDESFEVYLTTGRSYDIQNYVLELPTLQTAVTPGSAAEFKLEIDYTFNNQTIEFINDIFESNDIDQGSYLYCPKTLLIEHMLFEQYGTTVSIPDWLQFNYDRFSGKAAINSLIKSIQNASTREDYERALNVYYGLPVAPEDSKVVGLYESYGYPITNISGNDVTLDITDDEELHKFIQIGTRLFVETKKDVDVTAIIDRETGEITVSDASELVVGDEMHVRLRNKYLIRDVRRNGHDNPDDPAYIDIYSYEGEGAFNHLIDVINSTSEEGKYPEIIIHGTRDLGVNADGVDINYDGVYHITNAELIGIQTVRLSLYQAAETADPLYNDYIGASTIGMRTGFVHIQWPTHKFLYLLMGGEQYYKAYLDAPIDTIYDEGDELEKYQVIARNVSALTNEMFPDWYQFDQFKKFNGFNYESDTLEVTKSTPGARFGKYFPSRYQALN